MAQVNYVNPGSILPKNDWTPEGPLGGYMWGKQNDQFNTQLGLQQMSTQMANQKQAMELQEHQAGLPLRNLERQLQMQTMQGQLPHAANLASVGAQHKVAGQQFDMNTKFSQRSQDEFFRQLKQNVKDDEWKSYQREVQLGYQLTTQAMELAKTQGAAPAIGFMQQQVERHGLPEHFVDPKMWPQLQQVALKTAEHMQKLEVEDKKGGYDIRAKEIDAASREKVANINTAGELAAARIRASSAGGGADRPINEGQEVPTLAREIQRLRDRGQEPSQALQERYEQAVAREWQDFSQKDVATGMLQFQTLSKDKKVAENAKKAIEERQQAFYLQRGIGPRKAPVAAPQPQQAAPKPAPSKGRPPLETFLN
jgi:hypothetical protein